MDDAADRVPLSGDDYYRDPHALMARLTATGSVHPVRFPAVDAWLVTGYDAATAALTDDRLGKNHSRGNANWYAHASIMPEPQHSRLQAHLLHQDPPRHTAMKSLIADAFSARRSAQLRPRIRSHVTALIDALPSRGPIDFVDSFASRLPFLALVDAIGLPEHLANRFDPAWKGVVAPVGPTDPRRTHYERLLEELEHFVNDVVDEFAGGRGDTGAVLSRLTLAYDAGDLSRNELTSMIFQLLAAGQDPVTNQITMAILTLLREPTQLDLLRSNPRDTERAVEELLRYESAFSQTTWRFFDERTHYGGHWIPAGDSVIVSLLAANRDPAKFECPAQLDLGRSPNPHLAFGFGPHFCPGAQLARIEIQESVREVLRRLRSLRPHYGDGQLQYLNGPLARGVAALHVDYDEVAP